MGILGIGLLMAGCMYAFGMYKYLEYKKNEAYRVQILNYEMKRFMDQAIYDFNKSKGWLMLNCGTYILLLDLAVVVGIAIYWLFSSREV